jgi:glycosyltransferase involved in cell wall biosynthesis
MRVLMVFHAPPSSPDMGPSRRHYHVLAETVKRHDVTVLSLGSPADEAAFMERFGAVCQRAVFVPNYYGTAINAARCGWYLATARSDFHRLYRSAFQRALDRLVQDGAFDVVYCSTTMLGCYRLPEHLPLVGDTHNVEHDNLARASRESPERWRRAFYRRQAALTRREELAYSSRFSVVCATSERDRLLISALAPGVPTVVVPNGIDTEKYRPVSDDGIEPGAMLFTGLMRYYPNEHGARRFVARVLPEIVRRVPHARLWIVGADPPASLRALASRHITLTGRVPDVRPYYARAEIAVVPLWIGGGTRVKVLEAMAMGVPIVSTPLGCEGLDVRDGRTALIGDGDEALADAVVRALTQPALRRQLVAQGAALAEEYDWRRVALALEAAFRVARRRTPCSSIAGISRELSRVASTSWMPAAAPSAPTTRPSRGAS